MLTCAALARMTLARAMKLYKLPTAPLTPGLRPMEEKDVKQVRPRALSISLEVSFT